MAERVVTVVDMGSSEIKAIMARCSKDNVEILGIERVQSVGIREGYITDLASLKKAILSCYENLKLSCPKIKSKLLYVNLSGRRIAGHDAQGMVLIKDGSVSLGDMKNAIDTAQADALVTGGVIMHSFPQEYIVDGHRGIEQPLGMSGKLIKVSAHIVVGDKCVGDNVREVSSVLKLPLSSMVFNPLAQAHSVLTKEEMEVGVMSIDIGAGVSDVLIYQDNRIKASFSIPFGGGVLDKVIASTFSITVGEAEKLKKEYGNATIYSDDDKIIEIPRPGYSSPIEISRRELEATINTALTLFIERELKGVLAAKKRHNVGTIVLTGGMSSLTGINTLFSDSFGCHVRTGFPFIFQNESLSGDLKLPEFSCALGILKFASKNLPELSIPAKIYSKSEKVFKDFFIDD